MVYNNYLIGVLAQLISDFEFLCALWTTLWTNKNLTANYLKFKWGLVNSYLLLKLGPNCQAHDKSGSIVR